VKVAVVSCAPGQLLVDKALWMVRGFEEAGHDVQRCHTLADVADADLNCDLLCFDQHNAGVSHVSLTQMAATRRARWVQVWRDLIHCYTDRPLDKQPDYPVFEAFWRSLDLLLLKEYDVIDRMPSFGIKAAYLDQACPADMPACTHHTRPEYDALIYGGSGEPYKQRREDAATLVKAGYRVLWAGHCTVPIPEGVEWHPWVHPMELPALASRAAVTLGVDWRQASGYTSDRSFLAGGMGACYVPRVDVLSYGSEWAWEPLAAAGPALQAASWSYEDPEALLECMKQATVDRELREYRGTRARERIMDGHTYRHRAERIVELIEAQTRGTNEP
jgi:hypothetical protein